MRTRGLAWVVVLSGLIGGCESDDAADGGVPEGDSGAADAGGDIIRTPSAGGGGKGSDGGFACGASVSAVGWDEATPLGTPSEVFGPLAGTCTGSLMWDGEPFAPTRIEPLVGVSEVTVTVELDQGSAELHQGGTCPSMLALRAQVTIESADGRFADAGEAEVVYVEEDGLQHLRFEVELGEQGGTLGIDLGDAISGSLQYVLDGADPETCAGEVRLTTRRTSGGIALDGSGKLAHWSGGGCPLGTRRYQLEPDARARAAVEEAWGEAAYAGEWDDGAKTQLQLRVELLGDDTTCLADRDRAGMLPATLDYWTDDGRILQHTVEPIDLQVTLREDGTPRTLDMFVDDMLICADEGDSLPYALASCADVESVLVQIGIQLDLEQGDVSFSDHGPNIYEYDRDSDAPPGSADRVRILTLSAP